MARRNLTARFCETAKSTTGSQVAFPDETVRGLEFRVGASRKSWTLRYRTPGGVQRRLTLGEYDPDGFDPENPSDDPDRPDLLSLDQARTAAREALVQIKRGNDPAGARGVRKAAAKANPVKKVDDLMDAYLAACEAGTWRPKGKKQRPRTLKDQRGAYDRHLKAKIGDELLRTITRAKIRAALREIQATGLGAQLNKAHQAIRQAFAWGLAEELVGDNPAANLPRFASINARTRILSDDELRAFWRALTNPKGLKRADGTTVYVSRLHAIALTLCALLLARRQEVAGITDSELDIGQRRWVIPAGRSKGARAHIVPLPDRAIRLIEEARKLRPAFEATDGPSQMDRPLFPSRRDPSRPMHPDTLTHTMADVLGALAIPGAGPHDLRRTGATILTSERLGFTPFAVSQVLGHSSDAGGGAQVTRQHYNQNQYLPERRRALDAWEALLLEIAEGAPMPVNVRKLRAGA